MPIINNTPLTRRQEAVLYQLREWATNEWADVADLFPPADRRVIANLATRNNILAHFGIEYQDGKVKRGTLDEVQMRHPHFSANLRRLMDERGLTQTELARLIGVKPWTVWKYLDGQNEPSLARLEEIATALSTSVAKLLAPKK